MVKSSIFVSENTKAMYVIETGSKDKFLISALVFEKLEKWFSSYKST